jgi:2'-5' RNA ligase
MRCFIAIPIPNEIHHELSRIQSQLKETEPDIKWGNPENIHLTLKFLGEIGQTKARIISQQLKGLTNKHSCFDASIGRPGAFPTLSNPRVIWLDINKNGDKINNLQQEIEEKLQSLGFEKETRPFHPHLTLGRVRSKKNIQKLAEKLKALPLPQFNPVTIDKIIFFQSILKPAGAEYTVLDEFKLQG